MNIFEFLICLFNKLLGRELRVGCQVTSADCEVKDRNVLSPRVKSYNEIGKSVAVTSK